MVHENIVKDAEKYYTSRFLEKGEGPEAADWKNLEAQHVRFKQLSKILPNNNNSKFSLCDFGCGLGDYKEYLEPSYSGMEYTGIDVSEEIIRRASNVHAGGAFVCDSKIDINYDYIVTSGIFNVCQDTPKEQWKDYILSTLSMFADHSRVGFAFNCLTKYSDADRMRDDLYYADPLFLFDYCKTNFSRNVALLHDYDIYDFTILVRRDDTWPGKS